MKLLPNSFTDVKVKAKYSQACTGNVHLNVQCVCKWLGGREKKCVREREREKVRVFSVFV